MFNFVIGCVLGFFIATMGVGGVVQALDNGISSLKTVSVKVDAGK